MWRCWSWPDHRAHPFVVQTAMRFVWISPWRKVVPSETLVQSAEAPPMRRKAEAKTIGNFYRSLLVWAFTESL